VLAVVTVCFVWIAILDHSPGTVSVGEEE